MTILEMSFYGGVMILAVVLLRALTVHRLPKRTFVVLWLLTLARLLLPFTIPSPASVYTLAGEHAGALPIQIPTPRPAVTAPAFSQVNAPAFGQGAAPVTGNPAMPAATAPVGQVTPVTVPTVTAPTPAPTVPVWTLVWLTGLAACALFFLVVYVKNQREFRMSLPVENDFLTAWLEGHPLRRRIRVRQYDRITAPLTYGLVRPVILLPAGTDWDSGEELAYVLEHELIHIKRWDGLTKLLLAAAVCVHWFNPLVWLMFFLANRDLELSCDEGVLRRFGTGRRGEYARTLIGMEETRGGLTPIYNHFSKSAIEERVVAIMKTKKLSVAAVIAAVVLVAAVAVMFATSPREKPKEVWVPTLKAEEISEVTWSGELLTGAPACPEAAEAARLINAAAQNEVDSETLPNGRHGYVFADMHVRRGGEEEVYVSVGTVKDIVCISVGERSGYFEAPELYQRIASQNDTPDHVDQEALELYQDAIRAYLISTMPGNSNIDRITIDEHADLPAGSVRGYGTFDGETIVFRQDLTRLSLVQENPDWNAQLWAIGEALSTDPVDKIGQFMGNSYLDSQFRRHGMGSGVDRLVTANGEALGFLNQEWPELEEGLDHYDSLEELKADLTEIPSELLDEHDSEPTFETLAGEYHFLSGAGGWETVLTVNRDGTFYGQYHDSEMGEYDPVKYPNGTVYYCSFSGSFQNLQQKDNYTWTMEVETLNYPTVGRVLFGEEASETIQGSNGEELVLYARSERGDLWYMPKEEGAMPYMWKFDGGTRYITSTPYGLDEAKEITVYLPGTPVSNLPQEALSWLTSAPGFGDPENRPGTLPFTVLYNVAEGEAFFQDNSLTQGGETLVPLGEAVAGLDLSCRQEGESLFLNDGAVEIELRAGDYYVYRRGYVTDVLQNPMMLRDGVPHLPISFCNQYLSEGGDLCHAVKYFFKDEIRDALNDPAAAASRRVLAAVSLPRSMGIETVNLDPDKIFEERELDDYPEALAAELTGMGVPNAHKRTYSEYRVLTEARTVARAGLADYFLERLPGEDPNEWTVEEFNAWEQSELLESRLDDLTEEERKFVEEKDIQPEDLPVIQREFYFDFLSHTDEELKTVIEAYYQFGLAKVMGE